MVKYRYVNYHHITRNGGAVNECMELCRTKYGFCCYWDDFVFFPVHHVVQN